MSDNEFPTVCKDFQPTTGPLRKGCGAQIVMKKYPDGKWHPHNADGTPHKHPKEAEVIDISPSRDVSLRTGGQAKVADATIKDETGSIKLSLWDNQIDQVSKGVMVKITNGFINTFRGERQLNVGRYGKLELL